MRRWQKWFIGWGVGLLLFGRSHAVARAVVIRALLPNPLGSDTAEWIAVENNEEASVSALLWQLRDVNGAVTVHNPTGWWPAHSVARLGPSVSKINLNNDQDQVQLRVASTSAVWQTTAAYTQAADNAVWLFCADGVWRWVTVTDYETREATRDWDCQEVEISPTPTATPTTTNLTTTVAPPPAVSLVVPTPAAISTTSPLPTPQWQNWLRTPQLLVASAAGNVATTNPALPTPPAIGEHDNDSFRRGQRQALAGALLLVLGGLCWLAIGAPTLIKLLYSLHIWHNGDFG